MSRYTGFQWLGSTPAELEKAFRAVCEKGNVACLERENVTQNMGKETERLRFIYDLTKIRIHFVSVHALKCVCTGI